MAVKRRAPAASSPPPTPRPNNPNPNRPRAAAAASPSSSATTKRVLAFHFIRALTRIHRSTPAQRRTRTIRRAAYSSMARAASPRRVWSRALLQQMRARRARATAAAAATRRAVLLRRRRVVSAAAPPPLTRSEGSTTTTTALALRAAAEVPPPPPPRHAGEPPRADALRQLVPGGSEMEYTSLLEETADYVRCLRAQVQLMQGLVDLFSAQ